MPSEETRVSLSAIAQTNSRLAARMDAVRGQMEKLASELGLLSQEYLILSEALRLSCEDLNGGAAVPVLYDRKFPELNRKG